MKLNRVSVSDLMDGHMDLQPFDFWWSLLTFRPQITCQGELILFCYSVQKDMIVIIKGISTLVWGNRFSKREAITDLNNNNLSII